MSLNLIAAGSSAAGSHEIAGVVVAVCSAALYDVGYILEKQALDGLPALRPHPGALVRTVTRSSRWLLGFFVMVAGLGLQVLALTMAPVSVVQPILAAGLVALVVIGGNVLDERLGWRQRAAVALVLTGVVAIALSARAGGNLADRAPAGRFALLAVPVTVAGLAAAWIGEGGRARASRVSVLVAATGAGLLYGLGAVAEKAVATMMVAKGVVPGAVHSLATGYPWLFLLATLAGMVVFQVGLQRHPASLMATFTNVASSVCALAGASVVFGESLLPGGLSAGARVVGITAVGVAVLVLAVERQPAPEAAVTT